MEGLHVIDESSRQDEIGSSERRRLARVRGGQSSPQIASEEAARLQPMTIGLSKDPDQFSRFRAKRLPPGPDGAISPVLVKGGYLLRNDDAAGLRGREGLGRRVRRGGLIPAGR